MTSRLQARVTTGSKASEAKKFLMMRGSYEQKFGFIDDEPMHLSDMKRMNSNSVCIQLKREGKMTGLTLEEKEGGIAPDEVIGGLTEAMEVLKKRLGF